MVELNEAEDFFNKLNELNLNYFVGGGFGIDGLRKKATRVHKDIDMYLFSEDLSELLFQLKKLGYSFFKKLNKIKVISKDLEVDIHPLKKEGEKRYFYGNSANSYYPEKIFSKHQIGELNGFSFRVVSNEILVYYSRFSKYNEDKEFCKNLKFDEKLFSRIEHQPKSKPNNLELEPI
ncbi:MAG: hypothetical protein OQK82_08605 [Candidatus Pacearchaeota archaeon]|nr:hypothetical protein [Candidatus Pacearchaeota archaeon]